MSASNTNEPRILTHFSSCEDPRTRPVTYPLSELILLVFLATICGEEGWEAIVEWGVDKLEFLRKFLSFDEGIPSPDTVRRVIERINPQQFLACFMSWAQEYKKRASGQICIDGKVLAHALSENGPIHLVSAWCEANRMVVGAVRTASKSNEITAIPELLQQLVLVQGDVITIDAIGCQRAIVKAITDQGVDYVIAVKRNQPMLASEIENFFLQAIEAPEYAPCNTEEALRTGHGREDAQEVWVCEELDWLPQRDNWANLSSIVMVRRRWQDGKGAHAETRYYISSLRTTADRFSQLIRRHWSIENEFHWHLDVTFREDDSCIGGRANENLRVARMTALEMLRAETTNRRGLKAKARRCHRSDSYLEKVLMSGNF